MLRGTRIAPEDEFTDAARTGIVFVCVAESGERSFMPYRSDSADLTVQPEDFRGINLEAPLLHLGSNLMPYLSGRRATFEMLERARASRRMVSFDANIRMHLWPDRLEALAEIERAMRSVDLIKLSDEELEFLGGDPGAPHAYFEHLQTLGVRWLVVTLGPAGAHALGPEGLDVVSPGRSVDVVDTTGAGDGFLAGLLAGLMRQVERGAVEHDDDLLTTLDAAAWTRALHLANYTGSQVCTELGATGGLPAAARDVPWSELGW